MRLSNKTYDVLKWVVITLIPALIVAISGLGVYLHFDATVICGILGIVGTFIGSLIGISTSSYNKDKEREKLERQINDM